MDYAGWAQILLYFGCIVALTPPMGAYLHAVLERGRAPIPGLGRVERAIDRWCGIDPAAEQSWTEYARSLLLFSAAGVLVVYLLQRLQHLLPLNPQAFPAVEPALAFNTAVSFVTNTNWQAYAGESTLSYLTQTAGLAWQNFVSAAAGIAVALALARGVTRRRGSPGAAIGNFGSDVVRATIHVLLPLSFLVALLLVSQGVVQTYSAYVPVRTLEGGAQTIALGPVASQEAIKELGTNGGGFFNANSAHPFENPTPLTNFLEMLLIFLVPAGLTSAFGRMAGDRRQGWALFAAMSFFFLAATAALYAAESRPNPALRGLPVEARAANLEGKEVRFGVASSALFAVATTDASCGAVNAMHDSFNPLGGLVPLFNIQLGEVVFGGVGAGLYGMLVMAILAVFIAGLMVGRTPEYLGKRIETREVKLAMIYSLIFPLIVLVPAAWAAVSPRGVASILNPGAHGLSEILYAFTSAGGNNGSAFAGLNANTAFYNLALGLVMLAGRFLMIVPALALAGALAAKSAGPPGPGTFPTHGPVFVCLLIGVVFVLGALTFFPALCLGPVIEHFLAQAGAVY